MPRLCDRKRGLKPPAPVNKNIYHLSEEESAELNIGRLPHNLSLALDELEGGRPERLKPSKARLQELAQERWKLTPTYLAVAHPTPGLAASEVHIGDKLVARGEGPSRREAESQAAGAALLELERRQQDNR